MKAEHRLMGNFPSRGYGVSLSSPGFNSIHRIVSGSNARLSLNDTGIGHVRESTVQVVEAYHAIELHPLSYGALAAFRSATVAIKGARACSYTDIAVPAGDDVPAWASMNSFTKDVLRFNGFIPVDTFWSIGKDTTALPTGEWTEADPSVLTLPRPVPMSEGFRRSLLAHYWRCASLQFFGPWKTLHHDLLLYASDPVLAPVAAGKKNITLCMGAENSCDDITPLARAFLWQELLLKLPPAVQNIASMAAAVPLQQTASMYGDAALCVVYPVGQGEICFLPAQDRYLRIEKAEEQLIDAVLADPSMPWMNPLAEAFCRLRGWSAEAADQCELKADYDLCLTMWKILHADQTPKALLTDWYALRQHLLKRHRLTDAETDTVLAALEPTLLDRLTADGGSALAQSLSGEDRTCVNRTLLAFLWERTLHCPEAQHSRLAGLTSVCQHPAASAFFTSFTVGQGPQADPDAEAYKRQASLLQDILCRYYLQDGLPGPLTDALLKDKALYTGNGHTHGALQHYFRAFIRLHPDWQARFLPLTTAYLPPAEAVSGVISHMRQQEQLPSGEDLRCLRDSFCGDCLDQLNDYYSDLFQRAPFGPVTQMIAAIGQDATAAICQYLNQTVVPDPDDETLKLLLDHQVPYQPKRVQASLYAYIQHAMTCRLGLLPEPWISPFMQHTLSVHRIAHTQFQQAGMADNLLKDMERWFTRETAQWLIRLYTDHPCLPEAQYAFNVLLSYLDLQPDAVLQLYDRLLQAGVPGAEAQLDRLLDSPRVLDVSPAGIPRVVKYIHQVLQGRLIQAWQRTSLPDGLKQQQPLIRFFDLSDADLGSEALAAASNAVQNSCRQLTTAQAWIQFMPQYDSQLQQTAQLLRHATGRLVGILSGRVQECFTQALPTVLETLDTLEDAERLFAFLRKLGGGVDTRSAGSKEEQYLALLATIGQRLKAPEGLVPRQAFELLRQLLSHHPTESVCTACRNTPTSMDADVPYPIHVWQALMRSIHQQGIDWDTYLTTLQPTAKRQCAKPLAEESLPLLGTISASLSVLYHGQGILNADGFVVNFYGDFVNWLRYTAPYSAYTAKIARNPGTVFVGSELAAPLQPWLTTAGK